MQPAVDEDGTQYVPVAQQMVEPDVLHSPLGVGAVQPEIEHEFRLAGKTDHSSMDRYPLVPPVVIVISRMYAYAFHPVPATLNV